MAKISVFSASAGSGKTYTLARQVIDLLVADPRSYAHILAVTFTNKATAEMKERIVGDLDIMANGDDADPARESLLSIHLAMSRERRGAPLSRDEVVSRCKTALRNILLDYGQFSVSTIDRFVQRVIRSFAYEQGLPSNYGLQLEAQPVIDGAVDDLMESLSVDAELRRLILDMTDEAIDDDKSWGQAETRISQLGATLLSERETLDFGTLAAENVNALRKSMEARLEQAVKDITAEAAEVKRLYSACGIENLNGRNKKFCDFINAPLPQSDFRTADSRRRATDYAVEKAAILAATNPDNLKTSKTKGQVDEFLAGLSIATAHVGKSMTHFNTARSVLKNMSVLGVMGRLAQFIGGIAERNNKINMGGSGRLLADLIDGCPVPFVYEKIGVRYDTIMIDEFQDTSRTQYDNFRPLLSESLAEGHDCLLVGDVKQSIYRFRGGDWQLLGNRVGDDFSPNVKPVPLTDNYRSKSQIVNFNNALFQSMPRSMDSVLYSGGLKSADGRTDLLEAMYAGAAQTPKKGDDGFARLTIVAASTDDADAAALYVEASYVAAIKECLGRGYSFSDICILVRSAKEAQAVIERLAKESWNGEPIPIMSDDSLFVMSSDATRCIADVMRYLSTGEKGALFSALMTLRGLTPERLGEQFLRNKDVGAEIDELRGLGILELIGATVNMLPKKLRDDDSLYIDAFRQQVMDAVKDGEADLGSFLRRVDENEQKWTVWATSSRPAVKIMTIHKSKGLEFKVVIIPNADWDLEVFKGKETIWCPADRLGIESWRNGVLPLTFNKDLADSDFAHDYVAEREQVFADNLNLAYVAFTRPKDALFAFGFKTKPKSEPKDDGKTRPSGRIVKYLADALQDIQANGGPVSAESIMVDDEGRESEDAQRMLDILEYSDGCLMCSARTDDGSSGVEHLDVEMPLSVDPVARFKINAEAESRIIADADEPEQPGASRAVMISTGLTNHGILESVASIADLHSAVMRAVSNGTLAQADAEQREDEMRSRISSDPVVSEWFDAQKVQKVWTETSMVGPAPTASPMPFVRRRPDRVMRMADGRTVLVDYKFGKRSKKHHAQVKEYVEWLKYAGFENVEAYLWYYAESSVERVAL